MGIETAPGRVQVQGTPTKAILHLPMVPLQGTKKCLTHWDPGNEQDQLEERLGVSASKQEPTITAATRVC